MPESEIKKLAEKEAEAILNAAQAKALAMIEDARAMIVKERLQLACELELAARDFSLKFAQRLREQLFFPAIKENVRATLREPAFLKEVLGRLIVDFVKENPCNLDVLVPKELRTTLAAFFAGAVFDGLDRNCDIKLLDEDGMEGFALIKRGDHYVWDFRAETIAEELMRLVEPNLKKYFMAASKSLGPQVVRPAMV